MTHKRTSYYRTQRVKPRGQFWLNQPMKANSLWGSNYFIYDTFRENSIDDARNTNDAGVDLPQIAPNNGTLHTG